jgi:hypothetical protein
MINLPDKIIELAGKHSNVPYLFERVQNGAANLPASLLLLITIIEGTNCRRIQAK